MPDPNANRERLLRLIDGGGEALREMHEQQEPAKTEPLKTPVPIAARASSGWKARLPSLSERDAARIAQAALLSIIVLAVLHYGTEILKALPNPRPADPAAVSAPEEGSGTGLRLVGVDLSGPPVAMLEDLKTGKTYFARVNDRVKDVRVKHIVKNKVLVSAHGRTVELT